MRIKASQQVHSSGLCPALAAGFVGDMEGWTGSDGRGMSYRIASHMLSHATKRALLAKQFLQAGPPH
jgi:hypothetical protein